MNKSNGAAIEGRCYSAGTVVKVMPRALAGIAARNAGQEVFYTPSVETLLKSSGYRAEIRGGGQTGNDYTLRVGSRNMTLSANAIFGPDYAPGAVIEVTNGPVGVPPERRLFIGYSCGYRFAPKVLTYGSEDTRAILEDGNGAEVDLGAAEVWEFVIPEDRLLRPVEPVYTATLTADGRQVPNNTVSATRWGSLR